MKKRLGREFIWLSLPVLLLGSAALYQIRGGKSPFTNLPNPLDQSPLHLEHSAFSPVELTPRQVALGYDWGVQTTIRESGVLNVPSNWRNDGTGYTWSPIYVAYRRGKVWKRGAHISHDLPATKIQVDLNTVPRDAEEVRLRGQFRDMKLYRGPLPAGWTSPVPVRHAGLNHFFTVSSKPFDVLIKGMGDVWPTPQVSHQQKIDVVEGKWLTDVLGNELLVRFRAKPDAGISGVPPCAVDNLRYFDAKGKELKVFQDARSTIGPMIQGSSREWVSPDLPEGDEVIRLMQPDAQPRGGWGTVKMPITVTGLVSDGECWPTPFKIKLSPEDGELKDYGRATT